MTVKKTYTSTDSLPVERPAANSVGEVIFSCPPELKFKGPCEVVDQPDQSVIITLRVESHIMKRHRLRAGTMDINRYMWENILNRALVDSVY